MMDEQAKWRNQFNAQQRKLIKDCSGFDPLATEGSFNVSPLELIMIVSKMASILDQVYL